MRLLTGRGALVLGGIALGAAALAAAQPAAPATPPPLGFAVPAGVLYAAVGTKFEFSFCRPKPTGGRCGGPFAKGQQWPRGGTGGPYRFLLKGSLPPGLVLNQHSGVLGGTPKRGADYGRARDLRIGHYLFGVCVFDPAIPASRKKPLCRDAHIYVIPDLSGTWTGDFTDAALATPSCTARASGSATLELQQKGTQLTGKVILDITSFTMDTRSQDDSCEPDFARNEVQLKGVVTPNGFQGGGWTLKKSAANTVAVSFNGAIGGVRAQTKLGATRR